MLRLCKKLLVPVLTFFILVACEPEQPEIALKRNLDPFTYPYVAQKNVSSKSVLPEIPLFSENLQDAVLNAIVPSECGATRFSEVQWKHFTALMEDPVAMANFQQYIHLNRYAPFLPIGEQYFGRDGEYTQLVKKQTRDLERFWELSEDIKVYGQHNETLNDKEKLLDILWYLIEDVEEKEHLMPLVEEILYYNSISPVLPESPFLSSDGYASHNGRIVIGDGLVQLFAETGLEEEIVWTGILSHEWAHQIQFQHIDLWYPVAFESAAERTRTLELEADFFSGYYMTHKRGATYNWKRAEEFFELFYQAGDCSFEFEQHHGTPLQRKQASFEGYLLAHAAKKKGHILSPQELHDHFEQKVFFDLVERLEYL
ncbi:M48 family metalloprotease [Salinimicrobium sp. CAU 1759]